VDTHRLETARTGRYHTLGDAARAREVWFLLHGYGQSAADLLASCAALATPKRLVVAPEGLSRFYLRGGTGPVGASWMTREEREHEIADTLGWLDRVANELDDAAHPRVRCAMGFSQGAAAACRWAALGRTKLERLVLWGGGVPPDLDLARAQGRLRALRLHLVRGLRDRLWDEERLAQDSRRLAEHSIPHDSHPFDGEHAVDGLVLRHLADA
jgi:predicted esterase